MFAFKTTIFTFTKCKLNFKDTEWFVCREWKTEAHFSQRKCASSILRIDQSVMGSNFHKMCVPKLWNGRRYIIITIHQMIDPLQNWLISNSQKRKSNDLFTPSNSYNIEQMFAFIESWKTTRKLSIFNHMNIYKPKYLSYFAVWATYFRRIYSEAKR